ncbi:plasmid pRiA4b ORF-3 family protein [Jeotgalibacillus proteolyticus]|nr:plasmid pRiA4b ORF-3 family protein [Jeotgalibacillus proteolyticus]
MLIQCTKKLLTGLKVKPMQTEIYEPLFSWHANIFTINRRKTVVLVNDSNRYVIVLYGLKAKELKNIDQLIVEAIGEAFRGEGIKKEVIERYLSASQSFSFTGTQDRSSISRVNKAIESVYVFDRELYEASNFQISLSKRLSRILVGRGKGKSGYTHPNKDLYRDLEEFTGGPVFNSEAVIVRVSLELGNHSIWRRIAIPTYLSFPELHETLQIIFDWSDSHLHEFYLFPGQPFNPQGLSGKKDQKDVVKLVSHEESLSFQSRIPMKLEKGEKLSDYLPGEMLYIYDLGDSWQHRIVVEETIDDYDVNYPICLAGEGERPPEDVGGEGGYEEFLKVMADPTHSDYEHLKDWSEDQFIDEFDLEMVNRGLMYL